MLINKNNLYIEYNYKNILPFNLKKNILRVHANLIGIKKLRSFLLKNEKKQQYIKSWYHYFGINNLKKSNTLLAKKFLNKKLSVFFISNFNMVESKWILPIIYQEYYNRYMYRKKKKLNLFLNKLSFFFNYKFFYFNLFFNKILLKNKLKYNLFFNIKYIYLIQKFKFFNQINKLNINYLLPLKNKLKISIFWIRNIRKQRNLKLAEYFTNKRKIFFKKKEIGGYNFEGFFSKLKKKNEIKTLIKKIYIKNIKYLKKSNLKWKKGLKLLLREYKLLIFKAKNFKEKYNKFKDKKLYQKIQKLTKLYNFLNRKKIELIKQSDLIQELNEKNEMKIKSIILKMKIFRKKKFSQFTKKQQEEEKKIKNIKNEWKIIQKEILIYRNNYKKLIFNLKKIKYLKKKLINFYIKYKNKNIIKMKNKIFKIKKLIYNMLFISKKKNFIFKKNKIIKFFVLKKILIKLQLLKLLNEIKTKKINNIILWFYKIFIIFKYLNIIKNTKIIKNLYNFFWVHKLKKKNNINFWNNNNKFIKSKKKWQIENFHLKKIKLNFFIEKIYKKKNIKQYYEKYYNYFYKLKKILNNTYKNKFIINNKFLKTNIVINKQNLFYKFIVLLKNFINISKLKKWNILKEKWNKKILINLNIKYWLKKNKKAINIMKKIYKSIDLKTKIKKNKNKLLLNLSLIKKNKNILFLKNFQNFNVLNYNILWKNKKDRRLNKFKLYQNIRGDNEYLYSSYLKKINNKYFSILKNIYKKKYSILFYFLKYKKEYFLKNFNFNKIKKNFNYKINSIKNITNKYQKEKQYKKNYRLKKENKLITNLFKEFILGIYEEKSYNIFYKYLGTFKKEIPSNYSFKLSKSMKIKGDLWTAPCIIHYYDPVLIELRTLKVRMNIFWMLEKRHIKWKGNFWRFLSFKKIINNKKQQILKPIYNKKQLNKKQLNKKQLNKKQSKNKQFINLWQFHFKKLEKKNYIKKKEEFLENFLIQINDLKQAIININSFRIINTVNFYLQKTLNYINKIEYLKKINTEKFLKRKIKSVKIKFETTSQQLKELFYFLFLKKLYNKKKKINKKTLYQIKLIELKELLLKEKKEKIFYEEMIKKKNKEINKNELNKYIIIKLFLNKKKRNLKKKKNKKINLKNIINKKKIDLKNIFLKKNKKIKKIKIKKIKIKKNKKKKLKNNIKNFKNLEHILKILNLVHARKDNLNKTIFKKLFLWNLLKYRKEKKNIKEKKKKILKIIKKKNLYNNIILQNYITKYWYKKDLLLHIIINLFNSKIYKINSKFFRHKYNFVKSKYYLNWVFWLKLINYKRFKYINKKKKIKRINYINNISNNIYKF